MLETESLYWWSRQLSICWDSLNVKYQQKISNQLAFKEQSNFKEQYFRSIQSTSWLFLKIQSLILMIKKVKEKVNDWARLEEAIQEKLKTASHSEQIGILTLVLDKWSQMYCSEYFNILEYLVWTSHEIKKVGEILAKPAPKKGKTITTETLHLVTNFYEDDNFSR